MKDKIFKKNKISLNCFIELLLLCSFVYSFVYIGISTFQLWKDFCFYICCIVLIIFSMIIRKDKIFSFNNILMGFAFMGFFMLWHLRHFHDWGNEYRLMLVAKQSMYGIFGLSVLNMIKNKEFSALDGDIKWYKFLFLFAAGLTLILGQEYVISALVPLFVWYSTPMTREKWNDFLMKFSLSTYIVFVFIMTRSLLFFHNVEDGRYVGLFVFPAAAGVLISLAFFAALYISRYLVSKISSKWVKRILTVLIFVYPAIAMILTMNRAALLGLLLAVICGWIFISPKDRSKRALKRGLIVIVATLFIVVVGVVAIKMFQKTDLTHIQEMAEEGESWGTYIFDRVSKTLSPKSRTGLFKGGTIINAIDALSSTRISIWYLGIKNVRLFGNSDLTVTLPNGDFVAHVHNTFLDWLLRLGIVGGGFLILWFVSLMVVSVKKLFDFDDTVLFTFLWAVFCLGFFFMERELWTDFSPFMLLILQYPLLKRFKGE